MSSLAERGTACVAPRPHTWEVSDEHDLRLVVQTALDLLELGPPGGQVNQQGHKPGVRTERRPISFHNVHARVKDPSRTQKNNNMTYPTIWD